MRTASSAAGRRTASASDVQALASRTLEFLQLIERTVRRLTADTAAARAYAADTTRAVDELVHSEIPGLIDPEGRICDVLRQASDAASRIHARYTLALKSAQEDPELDDEDGVVQAFSEFLDAIAEYHNAAEDLRDTVETLDATQDPRSGRSFGSAEELVRHLMAS